MARSSATDQRFLERHNGKWRVTIAVPRDMHATLGTRIKRPLRTDSLAHANTLKWGVIAEIRAEIDRARGGGGIGGDHLVKEALELAKLRREADVPGRLDEDIYHRAEQILGPPTGTDADPAGFTRPTYDGRRERQARQYVALARGEATPMALYHEQFLAEAGVHKRTANDDRRAMQRLAVWCDREGLPQTLQTFSARKVAVRFRDALPHLTGEPVQPITLNKYLQRLSRYWAWLVDREEAETNVFAGLKLKAHGRAPEERAFTDAEVVKLLAGPAPQALRDLMMLGALTGARLDAIVELKVRGIEDGVLIFKPQKKERSARAVPIHPDLMEIVQRRAAGKSPEDDLFPEWPARRPGSIAARSTKASMQFTDYRRSLGVDDTAHGGRRSLVNFHSFRRWFITKAEQADQPESIIAAVVGHKRKGMTLGRYSAGPLVAQARRCVEAVRLPALPETAR